MLKGLLLALRKPTVSSGTVREVRREVDAIDLFALYRQLTCPLLVFNAIATEDCRAMKLWAGQGLLLANAYRQGLRRDLASLADGRPLTEVVTVDAPHMLIRTHTDLVAQHITTFLQAHVSAEAGES